MGVLDILCGNVWSVVEMGEMRYASRVLVLVGIFPFLFPYSGFYRFPVSRS